MPLHIADGSIDLHSLKNVPEKFLIFYSSIVDGKLWCPDCVAVDNLVRETFSAADSPSALIVYVGDRAQWKSPSNAFRGDPWELTSIPTIVKLGDPKGEDRLVLDEITQRLTNFVM